MNTLAAYHLKLILVLTLSILITACATSTAPQPPKPGTPAFDWLTAQNAFKSGDLVAANDLLVKLTEKDNEFAGRARPLALITSIGMAKAYMELSGKFAEGGKRTRLDAFPFTRRVSDYQSKAKASAMQHVEVARRFVEANKDNEVAIVFEVPQGSMEDPPEYKKITGGFSVPDSETTVLEKTVVQHEIMWSASRALGSPKDPAKARAAYQNGEAKVAGPVFLLNLSKGLFDVAEMFGPKKLNQPDRVTKIICEVALKSLAMVKDNKEAKDLTKKITDLQKKLKD